MPVRCNRAGATLGVHRTVFRSAGNDMRHLTALRTLSNLRARHGVLSHKGTV